MARIARTAAVGVAAIALVGVSATTAYATVPATLTSIDPPGGSGYPNLTITTPTLTVACPTMNADATVASSPSTAAPDGTIDDVTVPYECEGPYAAAVVTATTPWSIDPGSISNLTLRVTDPDIFNCWFEVHGDVTTTYSTSTQVLTVTSSNLDVSAMSSVGCAGLLIGDPVSLSVGFHVS